MHKKFVHLAGLYTRVVPKVMSNNFFCKVTCFIIDKPNTPP